MCIINVRINNKHLHTPPPPMAATTLFRGESINCWTTAYCCNG